MSLALVAFRENLPATAKHDFDFWRGIIEPLLTSCQRGIVAELERIAEATGIPPKTVIRKYYTARKKGITSLVDRRLIGVKPAVGEEEIGLSKTDRELVRLYCERNQRSSEAAIKKLRKDWIRGLVKTETAIDQKTRMPNGWSVRNLYRFIPTKYELKNARIGRSAAASDRPMVYSTRAGLYVGSHYMLDDMWHDHFINTFAENQAGRPLELFSHDLYSARKVRWGIRVRTTREDGKQNGLTEQMTRMILAATLYLDGYSPRGTTLVVEHGTAAIRKGMEETLHDLCNGLLTISRSGMQGAKSHAGQYEGIVRGNPRHKASLESSNNLTHNVFADLPGQTGRNRDNRPEQLGAMLAHNERLLIARKYLTPEKAAELEYPILELNQFLAIAHEYYGGIENDPDHDLEGWGTNSVQELLIGGQWIDQRKLLADPAQCELALALINAGQISSRPRKKTRREVWDDGARDLIRIPGYGVCAILGDDFARERKIRKNMFEFADAEVGPGQHRYESVVTTAEGERLRLKDGEIYEAFVNPFAPDALFVRRANGSYIGEAKRIQTHCRADIEGFHRAAGAAAKTESELLEPLRIRHLAEAREKTRMHNHNARVLGNSTSKIQNSKSQFSSEEIADALSTERVNVELSEEEIAELCNL